jgi:hypothetical protein
MARSDAPCGSFSSVKEGEVVELPDFGYETPAAAKCGVTGAGAENVLKTGEELTEDFVSSTRALDDSSATGFEVDGLLVVEEDDAVGLSIDIPKLSNTLLLVFLRERLFGTVGVMEERDSECGDESRDCCFPVTSEVSFTEAVSSARWCLCFPFCHQVPIQDALSFLVR